MESLSTTFCCYLEEKSSSTSPAVSKQTPSLQEVDVLAKQLEDMKEQVSNT